MRVVVILIVTLVACGQASRADYCERREAAWERAFPDMPQTADDRRLAIESCRKVIAEESAAERELRFKCLDEHIRGRADPLDEYQAMTACEGGVITPVSD